MQLEEELFELQTRMRIENVEINGVEKQKFEDFATDEDRKIVQAAMKWDVSDEDLFE